MVSPRFGKMSFLNFILPLCMASEIGPLPDVGAIHSLKECDIVV